MGSRMHVFGNTFIRTAQSSPGIEIVRFFINKTGNICPGLPKLPLNVDQWTQLNSALNSVHTFLFKDAPIKPCFYKDDHFENSIFKGCMTCIAFSSDEDKKMLQKGEISEPPAKKNKSQ